MKMSSMNATQLIQQAEALSAKKQNYLGMCWGEKRKQNG